MYPNVGNVAHDTMYSSSLSVYASEHAKLLLAGTLSACVYASWAMATQGGSQPSLTVFLASLIACALLSFWVCHHYIKQGSQVPVLLLVGFAILFRLLGILGDPLFEDDFYRYLWDGRMWLESGTPYGIAPSVFFGDSSLSDRFEGILDQINHPDIATVYGPTNQWMFGLAYVIAPGEIWPLQLLLSIADLVLVLLLLKLANPNWVLLYAWSPLMIKEFAFTAHPDVLGVALAVGAVLAARDKRWALSGGLLGLAAASKIFALILIPFLLKLQWRGWMAFAISALVVALPFGIAPAWLPDGLKAMASDWLFNAPIYAALLPWFSFNAIKLATLTVFTLTWSIYLYHCTFGTGRDRPFLGHVRVDMLYAGFFLCSPVVNAWYLVWLLPFGVLYPSAALWTASIAVALTYITGIHTDIASLGLYELPPWVFAIELALIALALCWDIARRRQRDTQ